MMKWSNRKFLTFVKDGPYILTFIPGLLNFSWHIYWDLPWWTGLGQRYFFFSKWLPLPSFFLNFFGLHFYCSPGDHDWHFEVTVDVPLKEKDKCGRSYRTVYLFRLFIVDKFDKEIYVKWGDLQNRWSQRMVLIFMGKKR